MIIGKASMQRKIIWLNISLTLSLSAACSSVWAGEAADKRRSDFYGELYIRERPEVSQSVRAASTKAKLDATDPYNDSPMDSSGYLSMIDNVVRLVKVVDDVLLPHVAKSAPDARTANFDRQVQAMRFKLEQDRVVALNEKIELVTRQIVFSAKQLEDDLSAVPRYAQTSGKSSRVSTQPSYSPAARILLSTYTTKITRLADQLRKDFYAIDSSFDDKIAGLANCGDGLKQQMSSSVGSNKVTTNGTSMYVRNYVNFGGSEAAPAPLQTYSVPELKAVPGRLQSYSSPSKGKSR